MCFQTEENFESVTVKREYLQETINSQVRRGGGGGEEEEEEGEDGRDGREESE